LISWVEGALDFTDSSSERRHWHQRQHQHRRSYEAPQARTPSSGPDT